MNSFPGQLLFDASPLLHCAKADRLDVLGDLVGAFASMTTRAVIDEIGRNGTDARTVVTTSERPRCVPMQKYMVGR